MGIASPESKSNSSTWWLRSLTITAVKLCKRWRAHHGSVLFLSKKLYIKYGYFIHLSETAAMQFIARYASIPVPKVYYAFTRKARIYIVMERIQGETFGQGWSLRTKESREYVLRRLKDIVGEMRSIPNPQGRWSRKCRSWFALPLSASCDAWHSQTVRTIQGRLGLPSISEMGHRSSS